MIKMVKSKGNVYADLGITNADEMWVKAKLNNCSQMVSTKQSGGL